MSDFQNFGSFRDPAGLVFEKDGAIYRTVNQAGREDYELFVTSGLAETLQKNGWLIPFREISASPFDGKPAEGNVWKFLEVDRVPFISYPYEWCFSQLRDSAILTLKIQQAALEHGMTLKDASAYNVQMYRSRPIFIDVLSFEKYEDGRPWTAYRQFCMHFLGPLLLMSRKDLRFSALFRDWIEGFPLDFVSKNLPWRSRFSPSCQIHIHAHARMLRKYESTRDQSLNKSTGNISLDQLKLMIRNLLEMVQSISAPYQATEWGDYYNDTNYTQGAFGVKHKLVSELCERLQPKKLVDLGANCGEFSRGLPGCIETLISADIDPVAVDKNYVQVRKAREKNLYPVLQDLTNPSPGIGFLNQERKSFMERARCDVSLSLALIHHLCIGNNLPFDYVAKMLSALGDRAILEFVPKQDSQVQRLLSAREDIFPEYDLDHCIAAFRTYFPGVETFPVTGSDRTLILFSK